MKCPVPVKANKMPAPHAAAVRLLNGWRWNRGQQAAQQVRRGQQGQHDDVFHVCFSSFGGGFRRPDLGLSVFLKNNRLEVHSISEQQAFCPLPSPPPRGRERFAEEMKVSVSLGRLLPIHLHSPHTYLLPSRKLSLAISWRWASINCRTHSGLVLL